MSHLKTIFNKPGVLPGFLGGLAVPLAILAMICLPTPMVISNLQLEAANLILLFIILPPLGAICSFGIANEDSRKHFITGITAPGFIISTFLAFNFMNKLDEEIDRNEIMEARKESIVEEKDWFRTRSSATEESLKILRELQGSSEIGLIQLQNGTEPQ